MAVIVHGPTPTVIHPVSPKTLLNYFFSAQKIKEGREIRTLGFFFYSSFLQVMPLWLGNSFLHDKSRRVGKSTSLFVTTLLPRYINIARKFLFLSKKSRRVGQSTSLFFFLLKPCQYGEDKNFFLFSTQRI